MFCVENQLTSQIKIEWNFNVSSGKMKQYKKNERALKNKTIIEQKCSCSKVFTFMSIESQSSYKLSLQP
ncbi:CLUMA_CG014518, isoform A [Clunio marinus]|uniref:CLUMA_CG014518, isoform A n=1 Tax=Clunio marinus TaxID=568069 RepID=A0A1J1INP3_9DIPT|nr:CLUMA_CG014518, isoform A [Clunio marinus]